MFEAKEAEGAEARDRWVTERKRLYDNVEKTLTPMLEAGKANTIQTIRAGREQDVNNAIKRKESLLKVEYGLADPKSTRPKSPKEQSEDYTVERKNIGTAFFILDDIRLRYSHYAEISLENKSILRHELNSMVIDKRDFLDLPVFFKLGKTFGVGEKDLNDKEFGEEIEKMFDAWSKKDHAAMKPYLDKMYDFVMNYTVPKNIESVEDIMKSMMYLRVQQTVSMKLVENPWYLDMRCQNDPLEKARFEAFRTDYFAKYDQVLPGLEKAFGSKHIGNGMFSKILSDIRKAKEDRPEDQILDDLNEDLDKFREGKYNVPLQKYTAEKQERMKTATELPATAFYRVELPQSALMFRGKDLSADEAQDEINRFHFAFFSVVYNSDLEYSKILRECGILNDTGDDAMRLVFIDGTSVYDLVAAENNGRFNRYKAREILFSAMVNQTGVVQFAHLMKNGDELKVTLETIDVSTGKVDDDPQYIAKLAACEVYEQEKYEKIRDEVTAMCLESKRELDEARAKEAAEARIYENETYRKEATEEEADFFGIGDVFDTKDFEIDGKVKERVKKDNGLNKLFKSQRGKALREQIGILAKSTGAPIETNPLIVRIEEICSKDALNTEDYNKLWKDVWSLAIDGLKGIAAEDRYTKSVPFTETTEEVERFMNGVLKLYGHDPKALQPFGGMTSEEMNKVLRAGVPTWETVHYDNYFRRMTDADLGNLGDIESKFRRWEKFSMTEYKNMSFVQDFDEYRNGDDTLNQQGKRYATASLIEFYDRINVIARNLIADDLFLVNPDALRTDMYKFTANLKKAILEIGVVDEAQFEKMSGKTLPISDDIEKFNADMQKLAEKANGIEEKAEDEKEEVKEEDNIIRTDAVGQNRNNLLTEEDIFNENDVSIDGLAGDNVENISYRGMREYEPELENSDSEIRDRNMEADVSSAISDESEEADREPVIGIPETNRKNAVQIDFRTFMAGRYSEQKNPNSAYAVVTRGELRTLAPFFGGIMPEDDSPERYVELQSKQYDLNEERKGSDELASKYGIRIDQTDLDSVLGNFALQNSGDDFESVNAVVFEKQYKLLFGDLYMQTLHAANRVCCREGKTITAEQMMGALRGVDKMMRTAAKNIGYPEVIVNGGIQPDNLRTIQNYFVDNFVPKDSTELALRTIQADTRGYNFASAQWKKGLGFTAFTDMVSDEAEKLNDASANTPEDKLKAAQMYKAMKDYNSSRSGFSKLWSWRKNSREKAAIAEFRNLAMEKLGLGDRDFDLLTAVRPNEDIETLRAGIEKSREKLISAQKQKDEAERSMVSESESVSEQSSVLRERISVNEADHKRNEEKKKDSVEKAPVADKRPPQA